MGQKDELAPCQGYRGWADMEMVEYKYPQKGSTKYVLRITLMGSSTSEAAKPSVRSSRDRQRACTMVRAFRRFREIHCHLDRSGEI